jgi:MFS family permease
VPAIMLLSLTLGAEIALVVIPSETLLQEKSPPEMRGRVIAVYFLLANIVAIPVMLLVGTMADRIGIPEVILGVVLCLALIAAVTTHQAFKYRGVDGGLFDDGTAIEFYSRSEEE